MDSRGTAFTTLRRRPRPSTANAKGRRHIVQRQRPQSSMGRRRSASSSTNSKNSSFHSATSTLPWKRHRNTNNQNHRQNKSNQRNNQTLNPVAANRSSSDTVRNHHSGENHGSAVHSRRLSRALAHTGIFHDTVPNYKKTKQQLQTLKPQDLFWTPSKSISASNLYFEGGIYQSLDVWARVRLIEAQQVNSNVTRAESSYHSRVAADTLLRVTRPCLIEHGIHVSSVNRIIKGLLRGTFGLPMGKVHTIGSKANKSIATTTASSKQTISNMLISPSWIQGAIPLLELQAYEEQFLPQMEGWREVQAKNRVMEINALNRACKSWQDTIR